MRPAAIEPVRYCWSSVGPCHGRVLSRRASSRPRSIHPPWGTPFAARGTETRRLSPEFTVPTYIKEDVSCMAPLKRLIEALISGR